MARTIWDQLQQSARWQELCGLFGRRGAYLFSGGTSAQNTALVTAGMATLRAPILVTLPDKAMRQQWQDDLQGWGGDWPVLTFPVRTETDFTVAAHNPENDIARMKALAALADGSPAVVLATADAMAHPVPSPTDLAEATMRLATGTQVDREAMLETWVAQGYERTEQIERRGHFAVRGEIVDVYPAQCETPIRIEFFDTEIDSIRHFDLATQRSLENCREAVIVPVKPPTATVPLTAYTEGGMWICVEAARCAEEIGARRKEQGAAAGILRWETIAKAPACALYFSLISQRVPQVDVRERFPFEANGVPSMRRQWPLAVQEIRRYTDGGRAVVLASGDEARRETIREVLREADIPLHDDVASGQVTLHEGALSAGFEWPQEGVVVLTDTELFGMPKRRRRAKSKSDHAIRYFSDLAAGDYVVHQVHGIGRYTGVETIVTDGVHRDYLRIEYAGEDRLFLPTERIGQLEKYIAPDGSVPRLHKMGGAQWARTKARAEQSVAELAEKLTALYAEREVATGYAFPPDTPWQREFEEAFPYEETADQLQATAEIKASMESPRPMDRLLCGDVGFGKTEVALRAVFKAVMGGKQVAVLVPTTVLSQQHYRTFMERLSPFGVSVGVLNRFTAAKDKKDLLRRAKTKRLDVLIGTHALLNKRVDLADLGLLVVDEEQRFGVVQKEKWKARATGIDILTLSATPIPRTLHMSLAGVREMSVIYTPPEEREPVQTYVTEAKDSTVRQAILRECERGGQVYFLYNRIASIERMTEHLQSLVPEDIAFGVAHGALSGEQLERVMQEFYDGDIDVLVCTSLIENGLDQSNANTIIIYDADRLGLSQLYQMRGRVGRGAREAYAYFLYRPDKILNEAAEKRLYAIREFTELGAGFKIALRDLEIRGAGNLLGAEQHGNMVGVGFTTYCAMLDEAIAERQGKEPRRQAAAAPVLELDVEAYLPDTYIPDEAQKLEMYRRLAEITTQSEWEDVTDELIDRFGTPPPPVEMLLAVAKLRITAAQAGIGLIRELSDSVEILWNRPQAMADWDIGAVPDVVMKRMRFLPSDIPRAKIDKIQWQMPTMDFLPQVLDAFLQKRTA